MNSSEEAKDQTTSLQQYRDNLTNRVIGVSTYDFKMESLMHNGQQHVNFTDPAQAEKQYISIISGDNASSNQFAANNQQQIEQMKTFGKKQKSFNIKSNHSPLISQQMMSYANSLTKKRINISPIVSSLKIDSMLKQVDEDNEHLSVFSPFRKQGTHLTQPNQNRNQQSNKKRMLGDYGLYTSKESESSNVQLNYPQYQSSLNQPVSLQQRQRQNSCMNQIFGQSDMGDSSSISTMTQNQINMMFQRQFAINSRVPTAKNSNAMSTFSSKIAPSKKTSAKYNPKPSYFGFITLLILIANFVYYREQFLCQNFLSQFSVYFFVYKTCQYYISEQNLRYGFLVLLFCCLQHPFPLDFAEFKKHTIQIGSSIAYLIMIKYLVEDQDAKYILSHPDIYKPQPKNKSDKYLKNIVNHIPYGIAVLDLKKIKRYNESFARVLGFSKSTDILAALQKFKRKSRSFGIQEQQSTKVSPVIDEDISEEKFQSSNRFGSSTTITDLKRDMENILKNMSTKFKDRQYIFENYYIEKEDCDVSMLSSSAIAHLSKSPPLSQNQRRSQFSNKTLTKAKKYYNISLSPISFHGTECLLVTVKDITTEKIVDQKEVIDKLRNMIFKSYTHELKTPLNGICLSLETTQFIAKQLEESLIDINEGSDNAFDEQIHYSKMMIKQLKVINSCSILLKSTMHDFFDYNQLQAGELSLVIREFDLRDFVKEIAETVRQQIQSKNVKFNCKINVLHKDNEDDIQKQVMMQADKDRLQQILLNLLSNSIKFTATGSIELKIYIGKSKRPPHSLQVRFKVLDTGVGIEKTRLQNIFNLFEKTHQQNIAAYVNEKQKSARMGLPISQNLCQIMGGSITVQSEVGEGAIFQFTLPLIFAKNYFNQQNKQMLESTSQAAQGAIGLQSNNHFSNNIDFQDTLSALISEGDGNYYNLETSESHQYNPNAFQKLTNQAINQRLKQQIFYEQRKQILGQFEMVFNGSVSRQDSLQYDTDIINNPNLAYFNNFNSTEQIKNGDRRQNSYHFHDYLPVNRAGVENKSIESSTFLIHKSENSSIYKKGRTKGMLNPSVGSIATFGPSRARKQSSEHNIREQAQYGSIDQRNDQQFSDNSSKNNIQIDNTKDQNSDRKSLFTNKRIEQRRISYDIQSIFKDIHKQEDALSTATPQVIQFESPSNKNKPNSPSYSHLISSTQNDRLNSPNAPNYNNAATDPRIKILQSAGIIQISSLSQGNEQQQLNVSQDMWHLDEFELIDSNRSNRRCLPSMFEASPARTLFDNQMKNNTQGNQQMRKSRSQQNKPSSKNITEYIPKNQQIIEHIQQQHKIKQKKQIQIISGKQKFFNQVKKISDLTDGSPIMTTWNNQDLDFDNNIEDQLQSHHHVVKSLNSVDLAERNEESKRSRIGNQIHINIIQSSQNENNDGSMATGDNYNWQYQHQHQFSKPNFLEVSNDNKFMHDKYQSTQERQDNLVAEQISHDVYKELERHLFKEDVNENYEDVSHSNVSMNHLASIQNQVNNMTDKPNQSRGNSQLFPLQKLSSFQYNEDLMHSKTNVPEIKRFEMLLDPGIQKQQNFDKGSIGRAFSCIKSNIDLDMVSQPQKVCCPQVMIVDDVQMNRYALNSMLNLMFNLECIEATNGQECLDILTQFYLVPKTCNCKGIKVIFMDFEMPVMNGIKATIEIQKMIKNNIMPEIPIVGWTAYLDERENCIQAGMTEFLVKPASASTLKEMLVQLNIIQK